GEAARARELGEAELVAFEQIRVPITQALRRRRPEHGGERVAERATDRDARQPAVGDREPSVAVETVTEARGARWGTLQVGVQLELAGGTWAIAGCRQLRQVDTRGLDVRRETRVGSRADEPHAAVRGTAEQAGVPPPQRDQRG